MNKKSANRQLHRRSQHRLKPVYAAVLLAFAIQAAEANPIGGTVTNGSAGFATSGNTLTVTNTPGTIINWQGFSIGSNEITNFAQQSASSTVLNRVVGNDPSSILGTLRSNGRVFLVNPNGILFGAGAVVDVAGLVASTLNLGDADFKAGKYHFTEVPGAGNISNAGNIAAQDNGQIYLIAPNVDNTGVITAPNGEILLAAGHSVDLVNTNDPNLGVNITAPAGDATNVGKLIASSGSLGLFGTVVRNSGEVSADSATMQGGKIVFKASQRVEAGGTISAQGTGGGTINLLADMQGGTVNVSGTLEASAPVSGDGGFIETSAAHVQVTDTARITTAAANGKSGNWLIDPTDFTIAATGGDIDGATLSTNLLSGNIIIASTAGTTGVNGDINVNDVVSWTANTLTLSAARNININANLNGNLVGASPGSLALEYGQGAVAAGNTANYVLAPGVQVNLLGGNNFSTKLGSDGNVISYYVLTGLGAQFSTTGTDLQGMNGSLAGNYVLGSDIDASLTSGWSVGFAPVGTNNATQFTGRFDGLGHTISGLTINLPSGFYEGLFGVIGAGSSVANVGLVNIALTGGYTRIGGLAGANYGTISNSYVSGGTVSGNAVTGFMVGGLVGDNSGSISNSYANSSVSGNSYVGGLVGYNNGGSINSSNVSGGSVTGSSSVGGLVGSNYLGSIDSSYANAANVNGGSSIGGLVGTNYGTINNSYAAASISGSGSVGGLAGYNSGTISNSYVSSGYIWGSTHVGGLVGQNNGMLTNSHYDIDVVALMDSAGTYVTLGGLYDIQYQDWLTNNLSLDIANYSGVGQSLEWNGSTYTIKDVQGMKDLLGFADNPAYTFSLAADIDLATATGDLGYATGLYIPYLAASFNGSEGTNFYTISNLNVSQSFNDNLGMFGNIASGATVSNVILSNANVTGNSNVGALAGVNYGAISYSKVTGSNIAGASSGVGGLAGSNYGTISDSGASGTSVTGVSEVGGLVGYNRGSSSSGVSQSGNIINSYVTQGTVSGSTSGSSSGVGGLAGYMSRGEIRGSYVNGGTIVSGSNAVGGLIGYDSGEGVVMNSSVTDTTVTGNNYVGGLVGRIAYSYNTYAYYDNDHVINAIANGASYVGGLAGWNGVPIKNSSVSGTNVTGSSDVGGLVGYNNTAYSNSSSSVASFSGGLISGSFVNGGTVSATSNNVGGLVGNNAGDVSGSYVNGGTVISAVSDGSGNGGGLVGYNSGSITNSFVSNGTVSVSVSGLAWTMGGLVGQNAGSISNTYASGGTVSGSSNVGGLVGSNSGSISNSYASTGVLNGSTVGGLVGNNAYGGTVSATFWNTTAATGVSFGIGNDAAAYGGTNIGATGLDSAGMMTMSNFTAAGWDIANVGGAGSVWRIYEGYTAPLLTSFLTPLTVTADNATMIYDGNPFSGGNGVSYSVAGAGTSVFGTPIYGGTSQGAIDLGSYTISVAGLYSGQLGYDLTFVDATLDIIPPVAPPVVDKTLTGEIVDITDQRDKRKPEYLVTTENTPDTTTQSLPMCN